MTHMFKDYKVVQTAQDQYQVLATHQTTGSVMTAGTVESLPDWVQISWEHEEPQRRFSAIGVLKDTSVERLQSKLKRRERSLTSQLHDYEIVRESDDEVVYRTAHTEEHLAFYE